MNSTDERQNGSVRGRESGHNAGSRATRSIMLYGGSDVKK